MKRYLVPREQITASSIAHYGSSRRREVECSMKVEPDGHRWRWTVSYEYVSDVPSIGMMYSMGGSRRHPAPCTVSGRARTASDAWVRARRSVALIKAQVAAAHNHLDRTHRESVAA